MQTSSALRLDGYFVLARQYEVASRFTVDWAQLLERNSAAAAVPAHAWLLDAPQIDSCRRAPAHDDLSLLALYGRWKEQRRL